MGNTNEFILQLLAQLDTSSANKEYEKLKKQLTSDPIIQKFTIDTSMSKQAIKDMASEIHNELGKAFKSTGIENFDVSVRDIESILSSAVKESNKVSRELENAASKAQKFLAQFNNKSGGTLINSAEFKAVQDAINGLGNTHTLDDLNKSMNVLETTYNNMVSSLRNSGKSLNPFINAKNEMAVMDETIKGIGLEFEKLSTKPKSVADSIKQLSTQQAKVNSYTIGTQEWADAYGQLQQMIQKVNAEISNLSKAKSANVATHILNTDDLDKQGKIYIQKINNTITKTKSELESKLRNAGYTDIEIKGVEDAKGKIKSLTATVTDATGAFKQLNFERTKIQNGGKAQAGFVQTDDVKVIGNISSSVEKVQNSLSSLKIKWEEQGVLIGEFKTKVEQLESSLGSVGSKGELNGLKTQIQELKNEASTISKVNEIQLSMDTGGYKSKVESLIAKTRQWTDQNGEARISTNALSTAFEQLTTASNNYVNSPTEAHQKALISAEKELDTQIKTVTNSVRTMNAEFMKSSAVDNLRQKYQQFYDLNGKSHRQFGTQLKSAMLELSSGAEVSIQRGRELDQQLVKIQNTCRQTGKLGKTFFQTLREGMSSFSYWTSSTFLVMKAIQSVKGGLSSVRELDTALVDLKKTTTATNSELESFYYTANNIAKQLGATTQEVIQATADWSRLGYTLKEAQSLAETSTILKSISPGMDMSSATETIVSTIKAYGIEAEDALDGVASKINIIGNNLALSNNDISEILKRSASAMNAANTSLEKTISLGAAAQAIVQDSAVVGTALKSVSTRIRGIDEETEQLSDDLVNIKSDIYDLTNQKVRIMIDNDTYKDIYTILEEISEVWDELSDKQHADLLSKLFGTRQTNVGAAILSNFDDARKAMDLMSDSAGNAMKEMDVIYQSLDYKLNRLSETGTSVAQNLFKRDDMKTVVDGLTSVMTVIDKLTSKLGLFGSIGLGAGLFTGFKNIGKCRMSVRIS